MRDIPHKSMLTMCTELDKPLFCDALKAVQTLVEDNKLTAFDLQHSGYAENGHYKVVDILRKQQLRDYPTHYTKEELFIVFAATALDEYMVRMPSFTAYSTSDKDK